ncbi:photosystem I P700 chlorophyll a apoprotein A2 [Trifolium repens]|nr:photosystem I P700 chlorophyll a apoprotein A2 [Trifolium repens]
MCCPERGGLNDYSFAGTKSQNLVDRDPIKTSFEQWAKPGHFSRTIAKGPDTTTWIWNLHADAHDFDSHTSDLEEISRKVFSAHFGQLSIIFLWLSGMYFHGARFSNYEAWLNDPTHIRPSAQGGLANSRPRNIEW